MKLRILVLLGALLGSVAPGGLPSSAAAATATATATATCSVRISDDWQRMTALCSSGPGARYRAWVLCANDASDWGAVRYYGSGVASTVECPGQARIRYQGVQALW